MMSKYREVELAQHAGPSVNVCPCKKAYSQKLQPPTDYIIVTHATVFSRLVVSRAAVLQFDLFSTLALGDYKSPSKLKTFSRPAAH